MRLIIKPEFGISEVVFLAMSCFRHVRIAFALQTIWMAKCRIIKSKVSLLYNSKLSVNILYAIVNVDGRFLFKEAIRSQNRKDIHYEVEHATIS